MASRNKEDLHPSIQDMARGFLPGYSEQGMHVIVTCILRTMEEQAALYAQGREPIAAVNTLRTIAGMPPLPVEGRIKIVTNARPGLSMHNFGLAFDVVPLDGGKPVWNVSDPVWQRVGRTGKECGLEWAGDWKRFRQYAHFQYTGGFSLAEIREGMRPAIDQAVA